jgi:hypothetical protein
VPPKVTDISTLRVVERNNATGETAIACKNSQVVSFTGSLMPFLRRVSEKHSAPRSGKAHVSQPSPFAFTSEKGREIAIPRPVYPAPQAC